MTNEQIMERIDQIGKEMDACGRVIHRGELPLDKQVEILEYELKLLEESELLTKMAKLNADLAVAKFLALFE